jgi:hypothetical protein
MADPTDYPGTPRWVMVSGVAVGVLALLIVIVLHAGGGLRYNTPSAGGLGDQTAPEHGH